jgi:hypothetical protein
MVVPTICPEIKLKLKHLLNNGQSRLRKNVSIWVRSGALMMLKKKNKKNVGGRPLIFKTPQELETKIKEYFDSCWIDKVVEITDKEGNVTTTNSRYQNQPYTIAGLASYLGFNSRQSLINYDTRKGFLDIIKKAKLKVEMNVEEYLLAGKNATGAIFWLKNHAHYADNQQVVGKDGGPVEIKIIYESEGKTQSE